MKNIFIIVLIILVIVVTGFAFKKKGFINEKTSASKSVSSVDATSVSGNILDLSGQGLTKISMSIFNQTDVEVLNLSNNNLIDALPSQIGNLKNLKVLDLSNNKFTGVPSEVGQLKKLEILKLSNNLLTGLPNEIGNLPNLKLLDVSGNNYSATDLSGIKKNLPATTIIKTN